LAEEDLHQGRFPCAIFAQDGVNLTRLDLKIYSVVGDNPRESFGDSSGLQDHVAAFDIV